MSDLTRTADDITASHADPNATTGGEPTPAGGSVVSPSRYTLNEEIARGGMGEVYRATDTVLNREVAVKVLQPKYSPDSTTARRFADEARITAQLQHPGIPAVHDLGTLPDGRPFLAMKLIKGDTLDKLLKDRDSSRPDLGRFLPVFEQICHALAYAHAHGVIHRDLKPANVMVGSFHETQVMDWGLAKVVGGRRDVSRPVAPADPDATADPDPDPTAIKSLRESDTQAGSIMGTPAFMAPEQAIGAVERIDRHTDVFGLGAILAVVLTGKPPFQGETAESTRQFAAMGKVDDCFARLDGCGAEPELVALCKRCLSPDPANRPANADEVAKAVAALRAAADDRARKAEIDREKATVQAAEQRKRRRVAQWSAGLVAAVLLAGLTVSLWQMVRAVEAEGHAKDNATQANANAETAERNAQEARDERNAKDAALKAEQVAKKLADAKREEAVRNLGYAKKGNQILGSVFEGLDPRSSYGTLGELKQALKSNLKKAARELDGSAIGDPVTVAEMQNTLGISLHSLGDARSAEELFEKAWATRIAKLGPNHRDTLASMHNLALAYLDNGEVKKAVPLLETALEKCTALRGVNHPDTLACMDSLAGAYQDNGQVKKAILLFEPCLEKRMAVLIPDHTDTLYSMSRLALAYYADGQVKRAIPLFETALEKRKATLGVDHHDTLASAGNLALAYYADGQVKRAIPLYETALERKKATLGVDHRETLTNMFNLAEAYRADGEVTRAIPLLETALQKRKATLGVDHPHTISSMCNLGAAYCEAKQGEKAAATLAEFVMWERNKYPADDPGFARVLAQMSRELLKCEQYTTAETMLRECLAIREKKEPNAWGTFHTWSMLGGGLLGQRKFADAEPLLVKGYEGMKEREKTIPPQGATRIPEALDRLIALYTTTDKPDEVKKYRELRAKYREVLPPPRADK